VWSARRWREVAENSKTPKSQTIDKIKLFSEIANQTSVERAELKIITSQVCDFSAQFFML
jgi:hypothetical protein